MNPEEVLLVYITAPGRDEALSMARVLVEQRLAACVNVLPGATSVYRWEEAVEEAQEAVLIAKTTVVGFAALKQKILEHHHYSCPCIVAVPVVEGHAPFLAWVAQATA